MPISAQNSLLQLSPVQPIDLGFGQEDELALEKLRLMKQEFAETKRRNAVMEEQARQHEAGEMRRAELSLQQQREKAEAQARAKQEEQKRALMAEFQKYRDAGDVEGIHSLVPSMQAAGMNMDYLGDDEEGLPSFQIDFDGQAAQREEDARAAQAAPYGEEAPPGASGSFEEMYAAPEPTESAVQSLSRLGALGPGLTRGSLDEAPPENLSDEDLLGRAQAASAHYEANGEAMRAPDAPDIMGGIPKNVIDFGAQQESIKRRLDPALGALQRAYPDRMQDSVGETNAAAAGMALPATKSLELAKSLRAGPDAALADQFREEAATRKEKAAKEPKPLTRSEIDALAKGGEARAKETFDNQDIPGAFSRSKAASGIVKVLTDDDPNNDLAIAFELPNMLGSKGAQSNKDLAVALGLDAMSTIDQIVEKMTRIVKGGFTEMRKESLLGIIKDRVAKDDNLVYDFLDAIDTSAKETQDPDVARGLRDYAKRNVPKVYRDAWLEDKGIDPNSAELEGGGAQYDPTDVNEEADPNEGEPDMDTDDIEAELEAQAKKAGLDVKRILPLMRTESGGNPKAKNQSGSSARGLFQFTDETARHFGLKDADEYAELPAAKQIELGIKRFKAIGLGKDSTAEDYDLANAAPAYVGKPDDTVIEEYKSGTDFGDKVRAQNRGWIPADGGEITVGSIKAFYAKHRSGAAKEAAKKTDEKARSSADEDMLKDLSEQ